MFYFAYYIKPTALALYQVSAALLIFVLIVWLIKIIRIARLRRRCNDTPLPADGYPGAAIIVYSYDEAQALANLLPQLLNQDYPANFEVIVVNEGDSSEVRELIAQLQTVHHNVYLTFTPDGARNLSRKKLAITLGIKAARMPIAVLTSASAKIDSPNWLKRMTQHFKPDSPVEIVIGYAAPAPYADDLLGKRTRSFDFVADAVDWLAPAIARHTWRGIEHNLAYSRDLFFKNKGFSRHLDLRYGDDDIFVSEIANRSNTAVELSDESVVEIIDGNHPRVARDRWVRRRFTSRFIKNRPRLLPPLARWAYLASGILIILAGCCEPLNGFGLAICAAALLLWMLCSAIPWRVALNNLFGRRLALTVPFLAATLPLRRLARAFLARIRREKRYTWE